ncbi:MAG: filamentous hemagglutinin N-terminal domain-containing protein [Candidatus Omnitrophica bacterium]|nr:filamentous hemagglutinin N-terminal domain-containing protein [Candidatus Omnitrophota bacterium]
MLKKTISILVIGSLVLSPVRVYADPAVDALPVPTTGSFAVGNGSIDTVGSTMTITQAADTAKGIIDFNSYNVGSAAKVDYKQLAGNSSITLNRVSDINPSQIFGTISANGRIFIVNPNGVLFAPGSHVDAAGLVASSLNITNDSFLNGTYQFTAGNGGAVINAGTLNAPGGFVALIGPSVQNTGSIVANVGTIALASGNAVTLALDPLSLISVAVGDPGSATAGVVNAGTLQAADGKVLINGQVVDAALKNSVNNSGIIEAQDIVINGNGNIEITGGPIAASSDVGAASVSIETTGGNIDISETDISATSSDTGLSEESYPVAVGATIEILGHGDNSSVTITDSSLEAKVTGEGQANIQFDASQKLTLQTSSILAEAIGQNYAYSNIEMDLLGALNIKSSTLSSLAKAVDADGRGYAHIDINLEGDSGTDVTIEGSELVSKVDGQGYANVVIYKDMNDGYWSDLVSEYLGDMSGLLDLLDINLNDEGMEVPIDGSINITNSLIQAETASDVGGLSGLLNSDSSVSAIVGIMSKGPITISESDISAANANAPAIVGIYSGSQVTVDADSTISATADDTAALVGIAAMGADESGVSLDIAGEVSADAGDGIGLVGLFGAEDVNVSGTVDASGDLDTVGLLTSMLEDYLGIGVDLGLDSTIGSAALIASLNGDITLGNEVNADLVGLVALGTDLTSEGEGFSESSKGNIYATEEEIINAKYLGLVARHNIGTEDQPLNTNVDVAFGLSWDSGNIVINEADSIELGLDLPLTVTYQDASRTFELGLPLAALDGDVQVTSGGDMTLNTVLAPNGNVLLTSFGNIYGGNAWNPGSIADLLDALVSLADPSDSSLDLGGVSDLLDMIDALPDSNVLAENVFLNAPNGDIVLDGSKINAENSGDANIGMLARNISLSNGTEVSAVVTDSGDAAINMVATAGNIDMDTSSVLAETPDGDATVLLSAASYYDSGYGEGEEYYSGYFGGELDILDSSIKAAVHNARQEEGDGYSGGSFGTATVRLNCDECETVTGPITLDHSDVTALVDDYGQAYVHIGSSYYSNDVSIRNGSNVLATIGHDGGDTAAIYVYGRDITIDSSNLDAITTNPDYYGHALINLMATNGNESDPSAITIKNGSRVNANVAGNGSASVTLQSNSYNYDTGHYGLIGIFGGSSVLSSVGSGSTSIQLYADDINISGSTLKSTVRDSVNGGSAYLYLYPYTYSYYQDTAVNIDSSVLEASVAGRGTARVDLGRNDGNYYYNGNGSLNITNGSSILASVGGGEARIWAWANDILVSGSTLKAFSTAGMDASYSNAYIYLYGYDYDYDSYDDNNDTSIKIDHSSITAQVNGVGQANINMRSRNYNYNHKYNSYYSYGRSTMDINDSTILSDVGHGYAYVDVQAQDDMNVIDSTITARSRALGETVENGYNNNAYVEVYSYDYYNNSGESDGQDLNIINSDLLAEVLGDGYAQVYAYNYDDYNNGSSGDANLNILNSSLLASVTGTGNAYVYLYAYDYYNYDNSLLQITNSQIKSYVGAGNNWSQVYMYADSIDLVNTAVTAEHAGDGLSRAYLYSRTGSLMADAASLITAGWVELRAQYNIGAFGSPINTNTQNLTAYSNASPTWVYDKVGDGEGSSKTGHYVYGSGNIYVNNVGTDLLNVGPYNIYDDEDYEGGVVQANDGIVSVTTQGDMVVHNVIAQNGGVFLKSNEGSIYAGQSYNEGGANVIAGGYSYISTPKGTIGVGTPESKDPDISGQILGVVDPGVTAVTGVNPSPDFDQTNGLPSHPVYFQNTADEGSSARAIWPNAGSIDSMENPLKVNIHADPAKPSALPLNFIPLVGGATGLTLQIGGTRQDNSPVGQMVNPLFKSYRAYYEILNSFRLVSSEPIHPTTFFAYHPLSEADTGAFDGTNLDPNAYEFIDGQLNYTGDMDAYLEDGKKKQ